LTIGLRDWHLPPSIPPSPIYNTPNSGRKCLIILWFMHSNLNPVRRICVCANEHGRFQFPLRLISIKSCICVLINTIHEHTYMKIYIAKANYVTRNNQSTIEDLLCLSLWRLRDFSFILNLKWHMILISIITYKY